MHERQTTPQGATAPEDASLGFGPHLMLDCRQCNLEKISDLQFVYSFMDSLPDKIGMHKIIPPYVFPYSGLVPEDKGITGAVIIAESHITFHSFIEKDYFFFDIFSCKPFDVETVVKHVLETFEVKDFERFDAQRGRHFPHAAQHEPKVPSHIPAGFGHFVH